MSAAPPVVSSPTMLWIVLAEIRGTFDSFGTFTSMAAAEARAIEASRARPGTRFVLLEANETASYESFVSTQRWTPRGVPEDV